MKLCPNEVALLAVNVFESLQKPTELAALLSMLEDAVTDTIIEIGIGKGGTSWALSKLPNLKLIIGIDLPGGPWGGGPKEESMRYVAEMGTAGYHLILGNSMNSECFNEVAAKVKDRSVDFLFIDGDHSYNGVKTDFLTYSPLVRDGGLIAFHDICPHDKESACEVKRFWDELKSTLPPERYVEFIDAPTMWGGIGVLKWKSSERSESLREQSDHDKQKQSTEPKEVN